MTYEKESKCNLVLYTKKKAKVSAYDALMNHAKEIAKGMSITDHERLRRNPTKEVLKDIMEKNNG